MLGQVLAGQLEALVGGVAGAAAACLDGGAFQAAGCVGEAHQLPVGLEGDAVHADACGVAACLAGRSGLGFGTGAEAECGGERAEAVEVDGVALGKGDGQPGGQQLDGRAQFGGAEGGVAGDLAQEGVGVQAAVEAHTGVTDGHFAGALGEGGFLHVIFCHIGIV